MGTSDTDDSLSSASKDEVTSKYFAVVPEESKIGHKTPGVIVKTKPQGLQLRKLDPDIERFILDLSSDSSLSDVPSDLDDQEFCLNISASSGLCTTERKEGWQSKQKEKTNAEDIALFPIDAISFSISGSRILPSLSTYLGTDVWVGSGAARA